MELDDKLLNIVIGDSTIMEYWNKIKSIADIVSNIDSHHRNVISSSIRSMVCRQNMPRWSPTFAIKNPSPPSVKCITCSLLKTSHFLKTKSVLCKLTIMTTHPLPRSLLPNIKTDFYIAVEALQTLVGRWQEWLIWWWMWQS
ncbi:hypothetical protein LXL04_024496 [Taraxacum kok-saghyz]